LRIDNSLLIRLGSIKKLQFVSNLKKVWITVHPQSGWLGFYRHRREKAKVRQSLNRCGCIRVQSTRVENTQSNWPKWL